MESFNLTPYLEDLERRIDPQQELELERQWLEFADGKCTQNFFCPHRTPSESTIEWPRVMVNDGLENHDLMILQQLRMCSESLSNGTGELLCLRSNYGTGIIPTMFGAEIFYMPYETDTLPGTRPFANGKDDLIRIMDADKRDYRLGWAGHTFAMAQRYQELTRQYPNISRFVHYYNPDLQGPLSLVEATWGSSLYVDLYDDEETIERALDFFTDVYIEFTRKWKAQCPDFDNEHAVEWAMLHRGGTIIRNDAAMNISGDMYEEFVCPRDQRIIDTFGGVIHFCGRGHHYIEKVSQIRNLSGINMSQPDWNDMEIIYRNTVDKGLAIIGMPEYEVQRATAAGRPLRGLVHCGASLAAWDKPAK